MISSDGLADSVTATVLKRKGSVITNIFETKALIEDCRAKMFVADLEHDWIGQVRRQECL